MDDRRDTFYRLTLRSQLHELWHRCVLYLAGVRYTVKLLCFTHQNALVLRHFQRCRKVEAAVQGQKARFQYLNFYKRTWQQCLKLFTPVRASARSMPVAAPQKNQTQPARYASDITDELPTLSRSGNITLRVVARTRASRDAILQPNLLLGQPRHSLHLSSPACDHPKPTTLLPPRKRWRRLIAVQKGLLFLSRLPYFVFWKLSTLFRTQNFKVKLQDLYQQQQIELLREQQRILTSTQTALFLSLANTIDLHTTRELATLCQHVGRARRKRKMTEEDLACFDQSVTELDKNHETLRHAA